MNTIIRTPTGPLRSDIFPTCPRPRTEGILIRYSFTQSDPQIDARALDELDCGKHYLGCVSQFIVRTGGTIETGRQFHRISSFALHGLAEDHLVVTIVGGLDEDGNRRANDTAQQELALAGLIDHLNDHFEKALSITDLREPLGSRSKEQDTTSP